MIYEKMSEKFNIQQKLMGIAPIISQQMLSFKVEI